MGEHLLTGTPEPPRPGTSKEAPGRSAEVPGPSAEVPGPSAFAPTGLFTPSDDAPPDDAMPDDATPVAETEKTAPGRSAPWMWLALGAVVLLALGALVWSRAGETVAEKAAKVPPLSQPSDPDDPFYLVPGSASERQRATWIAEGRKDDAALLEKIASQPTATWFAEDGPDLTSKVTAVVDGAAKAGRTPVLVAYDLPNRDCAGPGAASGGAADAAAYQAFIGKLAAATRNSAAYLILEPDAVVHTIDGCLNEAQAKERFTLLTNAVRTLKANPKLKVYLDAGNSAWMPADQMTQVLYASGLEQADGFALNVGNFQTTEASIAYGAKIAGKSAGKHFVIDTSRNGAGAPPESDDLRWCNPPGRALGPAPTTKTGNPLVDAYLWVKQPGISDGACRDGAPEAGQFWPDYALELAASA
ncbi:glycoside hydrolase family 6 protein [Cryptosporangium phraense]|uniref:Glucanase n=1 Tax=Cryptosporangium phraense TaxID=2593070 RepID=A0A545AUG7_9ACTN|nr:glycoside hydrolase family 6 protein [Cryptosporangium phraense]TQS44943.1 endoglucanase [Cryptosporangium phraense]